MPKNRHDHAHRGDARQISKWGKWRPWVLVLLIIGGLVVATLHFGDIKKFAELLTKAQPLWLAGALLLQVMTYVSLSAQWWLVLRQAGSGRPVLKLLPLTITKLFADQVVPTAGVSGNVLLVDRLRSIEVPREPPIAAIILAILAYYLSYAAGTVIAVAMLALRGKLSLLPVAAAALLLTVATAIPAAILWLRDKGDDALPGWLRRRESVREMFEMVGEAPRELVRDPRLIIQLGLLNFAVFVADAATLLM